MGRIPDHLVSLAVRALENRWVTIGAKADSKRPGKKKGGTPVELDGEGKITKGPAALTGKRPSELSQSHLFTGQDHKSQRKLFAEPGDPPPPPPIDEAPKAKPRKPKQKKDWEDRQEEKHQKALADIKAADAEKAAVAAKARELLGKVTDPGQKAELKKLIDRAEGKQEQEPAPAAIEPQAPTPPPATNLFGQPEPTKPQPATTQGLFGEQVPVEDTKVKPRETIADQAEKGLDWLDQKQDPRTDGTGEMFGGLFSPGRTSGATEPEAGPVAAPKVETEPLATARPTVDRRSYAARVEGGETPEQIAGDLEQRYDSAVAARNNPNATQSDKDAAQAEISHIQTVKTQKAHADFAEKMKKKTTDAAILASVEKPKITVEKSIGYGGKTGEASYLAKISGRHNGKTFNRNFQNGDEDKAAKSNAFRKKKGTYNETHEITPGELYEHAQSGTKKLFAIQPPIGEGTAGHKVYFEIPELKDASKILKSFDNSEVPNANGFGANADFVKPLLSHQHKMAKAAGSYDGLTLPVVARDMEKQKDTTTESARIRAFLREAV